MKKLFPKLTGGMLVSQIFTGCLAYYLLVGDNYAHCSISSITHYAHTLAIRQHLLLMGLLPIYIAFVIFGAALLGAALGKWLDDMLSPMFGQKDAKDSFQAKFERQS